MERLTDGPGYSRLARLNHIARLCPPLSLEALHLAIPEAKKAKDPDAYLALTGLLHEIDSTDESSIPDIDWVERKKKENQRESERLEHELRGYKNNLIKESIRVRSSKEVIAVLRVSDISLDGSGRPCDALSFDGQLRGFTKGISENARVLHHTQAHRGDDYEAGLRLYIRRAMDRRAVELPESASAVVETGR